MTKYHENLLKVSPLYLLSMVKFLSSLETKIVLKVPNETFLRITRYIFPHPYFFYLHLLYSPTSSLAFFSLLFSSIASFITICLCLFSSNSFKTYLFSSCFPRRFHHDLFHLLTLSNPFITFDPFPSPFPYQALCALLVSLSHCILLPLCVPHYLHPLLS